MYFCLYFNSLIFYILVISRKKNLSPRALSAYLTYVTLPWNKIMKGEFTFHCMISKVSYTCVCLLLIRCPSVYLFIFLSICLCLSFCLSVCLSVFLSECFAAYHYAGKHSYVPSLSHRPSSPPKSSPTFSVRPCSLVGRVMVDLIWRSWVRFPPRSKEFFLYLLCSPDSLY